MKATEHTVIEGYGSLGGSTLNPVYHYPYVNSSHETIRSPVSDCVVVVPTYNERENITPLINALKGLSEPVDILVVDDNSPDGTAEVVRGLIELDSGIYLMKRPDKNGLGSAYKAGFAFALRHGWKYICQMDADFSHNPKDICRLLKACRDGADVVIGSRYVKGGKISGWPLIRWMISRCANLLAQTMLGSGINDMTAGFKCFTRNALEKINLDRIESEGYIFQVEVNHIARLEELKIKQIPICFTDRRHGVSKMGKDEATDGFKRLWHLRSKREHTVNLETRKNIQVQRHLFGKSKAPGFEIS